MTFTRRTRLFTTTVLAVAALTTACNAAPAAPSAALAVSPQPAQLSVDRCEQLTARARQNPPLYASSAYWNRPAACFATRGDSLRWSAIWFNSANDTADIDPARRGDIDIAFDAYSNPVYDLSEATTTIRVFTASWGYGHNLGAERSIPWNPSWRPAPGNDHEMAIIDRATGREWGLWGVQLSNWSACATLQNLVAGYDVSTDLCVAMASLGTSPNGVISDFRTSSGFSNGWGRGMGDILGMALLPTLDEVERGSINHAVNMETYATMFGPACTSAQMATAAAGVNCGFAVAPATRLEWFDGPTDECGAAGFAGTSADRARTVPEGMRFVVDLTDAQIDSWLDAQRYTGAKRSTARIFAVALRDYGWIISDTTCWGSSVAVEGVANPAAGARWQALGVTDPAADGSSLLAGLITSADQVRTISEPSNAIRLNAA